MFYSGKVEPFRSLRSLLVTLSAFLCSGASGALLVHDPFDYSNDGSSLDSQTSASRTGFAASDAWSFPDVVSTNVNFVSDASSLSYGSLVTSGGSGRAFRSSGNVGNSKSASLDSTTDFTNYGGDELWWSLVVNVDGFNPGGGESFVFTWDHQVSGGDRRFGFELDDSTEIIAIHNSGPSNTGVNFGAGNNLLVFRMTDSTVGANGDEIEMWLNPALGGAPGTADFTTSGNFYGLVSGNNSYGFDGVSLSYDFSNDDAILIDEFRMGETFSDVAPIPEPASLLLLLTSLLGCSLVRRRRGSR